MVVSQDTIRRIDSPAVSRKHVIPVASPCLTIRRVRNESAVRGFLRLTAFQTYMFVHEMESCVGIAHSRRPAPT